MAGTSRPWSSSGPRKRRPPNPIGACLKEKPCLFVIPEQGNFGLPVLWNLRGGGVRQEGFHNALHRRALFWREDFEARWTGDAPILPSRPSCVCLGSGATVNRLGYSEGSRIAAVNRGAQPHGRSRFLWLRLARLIMRDAPVYGVKVALGKARGRAVIVLQGNAGVLSYGIGAGEFREAPGKFVHGNRIVGMAMQFLLEAETGQAHSLPACEVRHRRTHGMKSGSGSSSSRASDARSYALSPRAVILAGWPGLGRGERGVGDAVEVGPAHAAP